MKLVMKNKKVAEQKEPANNQETAKQTVPAQLPDPEESSGCQDMEQQSLERKTAGRKWLHEETRLRSRHAKVYAGNDGTMKAVYKNASVHYQDPETGEWKDTDNSFTDTGEAYETKAGSFQTRFQKRSENGEIFEMSRGKCKLNLVCREVAQKGGCTLENCSCPDHTETSEVMLRDVKENVDIQYVVDSDRVKENIIVKERMDDYDLNFSLNIENLTVGISADNKVLELKDSETGEVQFTIPGPFMTDASGAYSEAVHYEIETQSDTALSLKVVPDKRWMDNEERVYPITIDPQIVVGGYESIFSYGSISKDRVFLGHDLRVYYNTSGAGKFLYDYGFHNRIDSILKIYRHYIADSGSIVKATLKLTLDMTKTKKVENLTIQFGGNYYEGYLKDSELEIDVMNAIKYSNQEIVEINLSYYDFMGYISHPDMCFYSEGPFAPVLELEYLHDTNTSPAKETFALSGGLTGELVLGTGEFVTSFTDAVVSSGSLSFPVSHIFKATDDSYRCGNDWRLNLHQKLIKNSDSRRDAAWYYIDANGIKHGFKEIYYYIENGKRHAVDKKDVRIDADGKMARLYFDHEVFREFVTDTGLRLVTRFEGLHQIADFEQRYEEERKINETVTQYAESLGSLVLCDNDGKILLSLGSSGVATESLARSFFTSSVFSTSKLLDRGSALQLVDSIMQIYMLNKSYDSLRAKEEELDGYIKDYQKELDEKPNDAKKPEWTALRDGYIAERADILDKQKETLQKRDQSTYQRDMLRNQGARNHEKVLSLYADFLLKLKEQKALKLQLPVSFLVDEENTALGFNEYGDLCAVFDEYGNQIAIEYEETKYGKHIVKAVHAGERKTALEYNAFNQLVSITDCNGKKTVYTYAKKEEFSNLSSVTFSDGRRVLFTYSACGIQLIDVPDCRVSSSLSYSAYKFSGIKNEATIGYISETGISYGSAKTVSEVKINYAYNCTAVTADGAKTEYILDFYGGLKATRSYHKDGSVDAPLSFGYRSPDKLWQYSAKETTGINLLASHYAYADSSKLVTTLPASKLKDAQLDGETEFVLSAFARTYSLPKETDTVFVTPWNPAQASTSKPKYEIRAEVLYTNQQRDKFIASLDWREPGRQFIMLPVALRRDATLNQIEFYIDCSGQSSTPYFYDFRFAAGSWEYTEFNAFGDTIRRESGMTLLNSKSNTHTWTKTLTKKADLVYDADRRLIQERVTTQVIKGSQTNPAEVYSITEYAYNNYGKPTRIERFTEKKDANTSTVQNEKSTKGVNVQEFVYDEKGRIIKETAYNTLDSSARFVSEKTYDENGLLTAERSGDGNGKTEPAFNAYTEQLESASAPDGSKTAYGYDSVTGVQTAVSASDDNGEPNCNNVYHVNGLPVRLTSGLHKVNYTYDFKGRKSKVSLNGKECVAYAYDGSGASGKETIGSQAVEWTASEKTTATLKGETASKDVKTECYTDVKGNVGKIALAGVTQVVNSYNANGTIKKTGDKTTGSVTNYTYHTVIKNRLESASRSAGTGVAALSEQYTYNDYGQVESRNLTGAANYTYSYSYKNNAARDLDYMTLPNGLRSLPQTDVHGRNTGKILTDAAGKQKFGEYLTYRKVGDRATGQVSSIRYGGLVGGQYAIGDGLSYTYDQSGNITHIRQNGTIVVRYAYDKLGRIIREDNKALQATYLFTYDNNGNILSKRTAAFSLSVSTEHLTEFQNELYYGYDAANPDRLVYRAGGNLPTPQVYAYDAFGNPTQYGGIGLTWKNGRQLASYGSLQFTYDGTGKRIKKGDTAYTYDLGGKLIQQSNGTDTLEFFYDQSGLSGCKHGPAQYVYRKNLQGDITHIFSIDGDLKACYTYDAWGNHKACDTDGTLIYDSALGVTAGYASHIGNLNPFRYRSYLYDTETGWYFLKTRYYDPQVGRFVSQDAVEYLDPETVNGLNLYAYCGDNPVNMIDSTGCAPEWMGTWWGKALGWIATGVLVVAAVAMIAVVAVGTVASGGLLAAVLVGAGVGILAGVGGSVVTQLATTGNVNPWSVALSGAIGGAIGAFSGAASFGLAQIGQAFGQSIGFALSNARHISTGVNIAKTLGITTSMLMKIGMVVGGLAGGAAGGFAANYMANRLVSDTFGPQYTVDNPNYVRSGFLKLFQWLNPLA